MRRDRTDPEYKKRARAVGLSRARYLRKMDAPRWQVKVVQVGLALVRRGMRTYAFPGRASKAQRDLMARHVLPLLGKEES